MESIELCNTCNTRHVIGNTKQEQFINIKGLNFVQWAAMEFLRRVLVIGEEKGKCCKYLVAFIIYLAFDGFVVMWPLGMIFI